MELVGLSFHTSSKIIVLVQSKTGISRIGLTVLQGKKGVSHIILLKQYFNKHLIFNSYIAKWANLDRLNSNLQSKTDVSCAILFI